MSLNGDWDYGYLTVVAKKFASHPDVGHYLSNLAGMPFAYKVRRETVGQYAGLKDRNGRDIYEGDILQVCDGSIGAVNSIVEFRDYAWEMI